MKRVRTRYAPSPTGALHIGGARTALFNFLFAKHSGGDFIIRIEDTDQKRNLAGSESEQLDNLAWLGIAADESSLTENTNADSKYGPYRQSERLEIYRTYVQELLDKNLAYYSYDTPEELEEQRQEQALLGKHSFRYNRNWLNITPQEQKRRHARGKYAIRLSLNMAQTYSWDDIVRGRIQIAARDIGDFVIFKQDGFPTYNFSVVVDDHLMDITHVLRGEEHITNTPKQLALYEAFGWEPPQFGHLTIITNDKGEKLSKRDYTLQQRIVEYREQGYPPSGIVNFLALLGLTYNQDEEIMTMDELITYFDPRRLSKSPTKFDTQKLKWFAKKHFRKFDNDYLINALSLTPDEWSQEFVDIYKRSVHSLDKLRSSLKTYTSREHRGKTLIMPEDVRVVKEFARNLDIETFSVDTIQKAIDATKQALNISGRSLFMPIRIACTYSEHGPELARAIYLFGAKRITRRLEPYS